MRILLLTHSFNSLTQRLYVELANVGHDVSVELDVNDAVTEEAVALWRPEVVIAPFLKRRIPASVWQRVRCIVIHPGIAGDRGLSALDWAIHNGETQWGVTALEAREEFDAGPVWATVGFALRDAAKSSVYRNEVTEAAVRAVRLTLQRIADAAAPAPSDSASTDGRRGIARPPLRQSERAIDWAHDGSTAIVRKIRAADGMPGVMDHLCGLEVYLYDAHPEARPPVHDALPRTVIGTRDGAVLCATCDGAVWITHLKRAGGEAPRLKLPATMVLGDRLAGTPELPLAPEAVAIEPTWRAIRYEQRGAVGWLHFPFYNGAMSTSQCEALAAAVHAARARPTRVLVLAGGPDFWSNGINLNLIEAHAQPAEESWRNINAMNDLVLTILTAERQITMAAMAGNAGAGGVFLALAADRVFARAGAILNPHYKSMGNLYGSEYWTYLLPRRMPSETAQATMNRRLPVAGSEAAALGLVDAAFGTDPERFYAEVERRASALAADPAFDRLLAEKNARRARDEAVKPLAAYRAEELERMKLNFYGFDTSYHVARQHFVCKVPHSRTPLWLARHRAVRPTA
jgi:putative two-component system hydrogenase maturation factor HypX/HoxX